MRVHALVCVTAAVTLFGCSKVCEPKPLEGTWKDNADIVPAEALACGGSATTLTLGFDGKSGPHAFKILTEHLEGKGWKEIRYGGSSLDSLYEKDGKKLSFKGAGREERAHPLPTIATASNSGRGMTGAPRRQPGSPSPRNSSHTAGIAAPRSVDRGR